MKLTDHNINDTSIHNYYDEYSGNDKSMDRAFNQFRDPFGGTQTGHRHV